MAEWTQADRDAAYEIHWNTDTAEGGLERAAVKCAEWRAKIEASARADERKKVIDYIERTGPGFKGWRRWRDWLEKLRAEVRGWT